jgi:Ca2+-binding RTX toxin-like protein
MTITAGEQLLIELVNRARLDPAGEAARHGIALDQGLAAGTLAGTARQVLAPSALLAKAADAHSQWMLDNNVFSHTGAGGSTPSQRITAAGYTLGGSWTTGENLSWIGTTGTLDPDTAIVQQHGALFRSPGHRSNMLNATFREIGVAQVEGPFTWGAITYNASMVTEKFARSGSAVFVTGVAFDDADGDRFYDIGEGAAGVRFVAGGQTAVTADAGGYALALAPAAGTAVRVIRDGKGQTVRLDLAQGNVKLDALKDGTLLISGNATLAGGARDAALLGVGNLRLIGNAADNVLSGNDGNNRIEGRAGNDSIEGGAGNDRLVGGAGRDTLTGGAGADTFVFGRRDGKDVVTDFSAAEGDLLALARGLHRGKAADMLIADHARVDADGVLLDFGAQAQIRLLGLSSTDGLADALVLL